jgi:hypothetical protein
MKSYKHLSDKELISQANIDIDEAFKKVPGIWRFIFSGLIGLLKNIVGEVLDRLAQRLEENKKP